MLRVLCAKAYIKKRCNPHIFRHSRATFLANQNLIESTVHVEGDSRLLNVYHIIVVNPQKWPEVNYAGAQDIADFLLADDTQSKIGRFGLERFGQPLFTPDAGKTEQDLGLD